MTRRKVLVVGVDGVRTDRLRAIAPPVLTNLLERAAFGTSLLPYGVPDGSDDVVGRAWTDSGPGWSTIATGVWPQRHEVFHNLAFTSSRLDEHPDFLTRARTARAGLVTGAAVSWAALTRFGVVGRGADLVTTSDGDADGYEGADAHVADAVTGWLDGAAPDALFVYLGATDEAAHDHGPLGAQFTSALLAVDAHLGRILDAVGRRPDDEDWTVVVTTDHGHRDEGGHGGTTDAEREVFVAVAPARGPGRATTLAAPALVDVAPTALAALGIPVDPAWGLDGAPLT